MGPLARLTDRRIDHRAALAQQPVVNDVKGMLATLDNKINALAGPFERVSDTARGQSELLQALADAVRVLSLRCDEFERSFTGAAEHFERYRSVVPTLLDAVSAQHSATRELKRHQVEELTRHRDEVWRSISGVEARMAGLEERTERARQELFFELRHGGADRGVIEAKVEPKVVNREKVDAMGQDLRLNLGCGPYPVEGYVNVDVREIDDVVDVVADLGHLPFEPGSVAEIFSSHVLEHFPEEELARRLLPYWVSLLKPGGAFRAIVPDAEAMMRSWAEGGKSFEDLRLVTFGGQEYDGDFHFTMFTVDSLAARLRRSGLEAVEVLATGRPNGLCYELELRATRPAPAPA